MTAQVDYLAVLFTATSGASGELLGTDERELVQLVWQLVNLKTKKVIRIYNNCSRAADVLLISCPVEVKGIVEGNETEKQKLFSALI